MSALVITSDTPNVDLEYLSERLTDVTVEQRPLDGDDAIAVAASEADALAINVHTPVQADHLSEDADLALIARFGTGFDNIDLEAASDHGIAVTNVPDYCTDEVATHAFGLLLACRRHIPAYDRAVRDGEWDWQTEPPIRRVAGSTLGLVSFGAIAQRLADQLEGLGLDLLVYDPYVEESTVEAYDARLVAFDELLAESDAISIHAPLTPDTRGMFDADAFAAMREHAVLVNVGRGSIIDEPALADALEAGEIAAAGLDVLETEPPEPGHALDGLENVVITPHAAFYSQEARRDLNATVATQIEQALNGDEPDHAVDPDAWS